MIYMTAIWLLRRATATLIATSSILCLFAISANAQGPKVGMYYTLWFYPGSTGNPCSGSGWNNDIFMIPRSGSTPPIPQVMSLLPNINGGGCYDSNNTNTGFVHAKYLHDIGADFVVFDDTNGSNSEYASADHEYLSALTTVEGFGQYTQKAIQAAFMITIESGYTYASTGNSWDSYVSDHIQNIANQYQANPNAYFEVDGKPLLLVYISQGTDIYSPTGSHAFNGPGNIDPTASDWNPSITVDGSTVSVRDYFSVRFAMYEANESGFDYTSYGTDLWPYTCEGTCTFSEAGYAALYSNSWGDRDIGQFNNEVSASESKGYMMIRSWNEFSSTDENEGATWTIEPNTELPIYDGTSSDPWHFYNQVRTTLTALKMYQLISDNSSKCMDVIGVSTSPGAGIQQYSCIGQSQLNQIWSLVPQNTVPTTSPLNYELLSANSSLCLSVPSNSTSNNTLLDQEGCTGTSGQLWQLGNPTTGYFQLSPLSNTAECADVVDQSTSDGALVQQYTCLGASQTNQLWEFALNGGSYNPPVVSEPFLLQNSGFEYGLASWNVNSGSESINTSSGFIHSGQNSLAQGGDGVEGVIYQDIYGLTPGASYLVSAWVSASSSSNNGVQLAVQDTQGSNWSSITVTPNGSFQWVTVSYTADSTGAVRVHLVSNSGSYQTTYWDDVRVDVQ